MSSYRTHRPRAYAASKLSEILARWNGPLGAAVREYGPAIWPGIPTQALLAFSMNSSGQYDALTAAGFWEIGFFNTPAGSPSQPAATGGAWATIARSDEFRRIVGRSGVIGSGWRDAVVDQAVIGLIDYRNDIQNIARGIPLDLVPQGMSQWAWACGSMGYTLSTNARVAINQSADALRAVSDPWRFGTLLAATAERGFTTGRSGTAYPLIRAWQRLECGRLLTEQTGGDLAWFDLGLGSYTDAVEHRITVAMYGDPDAPLQPGALGTVGMEIPGGSSGLLKLAGVALIAFAGYQGWKIYRGGKRRSR